MSFVRRFLGVALIGLLPTLLAAQESKKHALLVGVNKYQHADMNKPQALEYAEADVLAIKKVLEDSNYKVTLLQGEQATLANIRTELATLRKNGTGAKVVLVAFAGHGLQPEDSKEAYFCPYNADQAVVDRDGKKVADWDMKTMLPLSDVLVELKACGAEAKALLVDACRNDPKAGRGRGFGTGYNVGDLPENLALLLSCSKGERAWEDKTWGHGAYFHHVLKGLREGKAALDGHITASSLSAYAHRAVKQEVPKVIGGGATQQPHAIINGNVDLLIDPSASVRGERLLATWGRDFTLDREERYLFSADKVQHSVAGKYDFYPDYVEIGTYTLKGDVLTITYTQRDGKAIEGRTVEFTVKELTATQLSLVGKDRKRIDLERLDAVTKRQPGEEQSVDLGEGVKMVFCWVPPSAEQRHGFWLSKYEVTQAEWSSVANRTPSFFASTGAGADQVKTLDTKRFPVENVSWDDAQTFLNRLNITHRKDMTLGRGTFQLPTKNEWAYACQGGRKALPALTKDNANTEKHHGRPLAVDHAITVQQHPWGLCHMQGNVAEWCEDLAAKTTKRYASGGHYEDKNSDCQPTSVREVPADFASPTIGVRVKFQDTK